MKRLYTAFALIAVASLSPVAAQVSIEAASPAKEEIAFTDQVKQNDVKSEFSNEAQRRAERAAIRKERNTLEFNAALNGSLSNFNSKWQSVNGNSNSITAISSILFTHSFKKDKFSIDNKFTAKLGATNNENGWVKSQDEWFASTAPAYRISDNWNFGANISLRSQFANGVDGKTDERTSRFFSPAYFNVSLGFTYVCPKKGFPVKINLSPISMSATYVDSRTVRDVFYKKKFGATSEADLTPEQRNTPYCYGLTFANGTSRYEGGSSVQIDFDRTFGKKGIFRYRTTLYSFYGWINEITQQTSKDRDLFDNIAPTLRWEHTVDIKATKYFSTQFYFQMYYNEAQISSLQTQIVLGVGLSYTFKNK